MTSERQAFVHVQLPGTLETVPAALLKVEKRDDGTFVGRFRYGDRYLKRPGAVALDPFQLPLSQTVYEVTKLKGIPGAVRDASPDAWGRRVIEARLERGPADLDEVDYLLHGPQDGAGNVSFGSGPQPTVLTRPYNRTHQFTGLIAATEAIEAGEKVPAQILKQLEPGTSMGGARPKATIEDGNRLWIAKFPEKGDRFNLQRVEYATLALARKCGINVCHTRLEAIAGKDVLMLERFDRERAADGYLRFALVSGLTLLDCEDSHLERDRWSYALLADQLRRWTDRPDRDCAELFQRIVFNAAVTNNDDHPRNHAVIRDQKGWQLSPAYDLVPMPVISQERRDLALTVGDYGRTASVCNLLSQSARFGLNLEEARNHIENISSVVRGWREHFAICGVSAKDIDYIAPAFLPGCFFFENPPEQPMLT